MYFYLFVKGIIDSGIKHGLSFEQAKTLAVNTMIGSGKMILKNKEKTEVKVTKTENTKNNRKNRRKNKKR